MKVVLYCAFGGKMKNKNYAGIDYFRLIAAFMVIGIHIGPFSSWNRNVDFLITYCLGRIAVPFFLMTTGYFVLTPYVLSAFQTKQFVYKYFMKNSRLYLAATLFYLPISIYAGNVPHSIGGVFKSILFDGTFYHLWYFPAVLVGTALLIVLMRKSMRIAAAFSVVMYIVGIFGDSYYGMVENIPLMKEIYNGIFFISSYTRNGIFFAPVFILLGMLIGFSDTRYSRRKCRVGIALSLLCMLVEGFITYKLNLQKHNSMYMFLLPIMYFLFQRLLMIQGKAPYWIRKSSVLVYILHPTVIILLRGIAKVTGTAKLLIENTFIQYISVCIFSLTLALGIQFCMERRKSCVSKRTSVDRNRS